MISLGINKPIFTRQSETQVLICGPLCPGLQGSGAGPRGGVCYRPPSPAGRGLRLGLPGPRAQSPALLGPAPSPPGVLEPRRRPPSLCARPGACPPRHSQKTRRDLPLRDRPRPGAVLLLARAGRLPGELLFFFSLKGLVGEGKGLVQSLLGLCAGARRSGPQLWRTD